MSRPFEFCMKSRVILQRYGRVSFIGFFSIKKAHKCGRDCKGIEPQIRYSFSAVIGGLESIKCFLKKLLQWFRQYDILFKSPLKHSADNEKSNTNKFDL
ncbi:hypothetical protein SAMN05518856_1282 [Paenibacillus sp. OK003]|nr:hypothetical protein SAMN05518856_1282 [Paenibacillus sp. OK003]